jgi:hypothetical protein
VFRLWPNNPHFQRAGAKLETGPPVDPSGRELVSSHPNPTTLEVRPAGTLAAGQAVEVNLPWTLTLPSFSVTDRISVQAGTLRLGSFFPLLAWQPGVGWATDPPASGLGEASTSPTADFDVSVTAPRGLDIPTPAPAAAATATGAGGPWRCGTSPCRPATSAWQPASPTRRTRCG